MLKLQMPLVKEQTLALPALNASGLLFLNLSDDLGC